jgi:tRNA (guanine37-N1)-methyltransferase
MVTSACSYGICGRAIESGLMAVTCINPRDFAEGVHRSVDDRPYGGGPGMVMMVEPLRRAIVAAKEQLGLDAPVVYLSPQGRAMDQSWVAKSAEQSAMILLCGRYEGIDERLIQTQVDYEMSLGDFVLSGGEVPALAVIDAMARLLPGALGHAHSATQDSFADGLLDCPHYTRPETIESLTVPPVLMSGHHKNIKRWRLSQSLARTAQRRPDLLRYRELSDLERTLVEDLPASTRAKLRVEDDEQCD